MLPSSIAFTVSVIVCFSTVVVVLSALTHVASTTIVLPSCASLFAVTSPIFLSIVALPDFILQLIISVDPSGVFVASICNVLPGAISAGALFFTFKLNPVAFTGAVFTSVLIVLFTDVVVSVTLNVNVPVVSPAFTFM